nr:trehalose-phosphatase [Hymenobacter pini]
MVDAFSVGSDYKRYAEAAASAAVQWLGPEQPDFILAIGDDRTDEDTFAALPATAYSLKVGPIPRSLARYSAANVADVRQLLGSLAHVQRELASST